MICGRSATQRRLGGTGFGSASAPPAPTEIPPHAMTRCGSIPPPLTPRTRVPTDGTPAQIDGTQHAPTPQRTPAPIPDTPLAPQRTPRCTLTTRPFRKRTPHRTLITRPFRKRTPHRTLTTRPFRKRTPRRTRVVSPFAKRRRRCHPAGLPYAKTELARVAVTRLYAKTELARVPATRLYAKTWPARVPATRPDAEPELARVPATRLYAETEPARVPTTRPDADGAWFSAGLWPVAAVGGVERSTFPIEVMEPDSNGAVPALTGAKSSACQGLVPRGIRSPQRVAQGTARWRC
jgi:hypothetical protein